MLLTKPRAAYNMWHVYTKELLELLRDKKTLFFVIALPLIVFPLLFGIMALFVTNATLAEQQKVLRYSIINESNAPEYSKAMLYHRDFKKTNIKLLEKNNSPDGKALKLAGVTYSKALEKEISNAINQQQIDVVIFIPHDYIKDNIDQKQSQWRLYFNNAAQISFVQQKINKVFKRYTQEITEDQLASLNISKERFKLLTAPVKLTTINTAKQRESVGEQIGGIIPYMLILLCLTGAMYPAIDIGAGEKERGTLETLLLTPMSKTALVLGKFITIVTTAITTALITVGSFIFWSYFIGKMLNIKEISNIIEAIALFDVLSMVAMLIPVAAIFAGIVLALSIYAKSYKEAQNYMAPLTMVAFIPVMVAMLPGVELDGIWAIIPIANVALAIKEILKGTIETSAVLYIFTSSTVFAMLSLWFCTRCFKKESVLFR